MFLYFGKWDFKTLRLKKFLYFLKKKAFLIFRKMKLFKKHSIFQEGTSRARKIKKPTLKNFLYFGKWNCLALRSAKFFLYFRREHAKPENQKFVIFCFTFFVC